MRSYELHSIEYEYWKHRLFYQNQRKCHNPLFNNPQFVLYFTQLLTHNTIYPSQHNHSNPTTSISQKDESTEIKTITCIRLYITRSIAPTPTYISIFFVYYCIKNTFKSQKHVHVHNVKPNSRHIYQHTCIFSLISTATT